MAEHHPSEQVKVMHRQSSFDPNNNQIPDNDEISGAEDETLSATTDELVEAINGRLLERSQEESSKDIGDDDDKSSVDQKSEFNEDEVDSLFSGVEEEEEEESDPVTKEPYDVDKVLISTFLEHTTSIVRRVDILLPFPFYNNCSQFLPIYSVFLSL